MMRMLLALALLLAVGNARALMFPDQGAAYQACMSSLNGAGHCAAQGHESVATQTCAHTTSGANGMYRFRYSCNRKASNGGGVTNPTTIALPEHLYPLAKTCAARTGDGDGPPSSSNAILVGTGETCYNGCAYGAPLGEGTTRFSFSAGQTVSYVPGGSRNPTGATCNADGGEFPAPSSEYCAKVGDLTQCLQQDGRHCAVGKSGKRHCWKPNETGTKVSSNEASTKSPQGVGINPPPVPPKNNGTWEQSGSGTVSVTSGGVTNNYNVTNNTSNYGPEGEGGGAEGEGEGDGEGEGEGDGQAPGGVGTLYEGTDKSVVSLLTAFYGQITATPLIASVTSFMTAQGNGSCPVWTLPASEYWEAMVIDWHCTGTFYNFLLACGWVIFAAACYLAVKIALT